MCEHSFLVGKMCRWRGIRGRLMLQQPGTTELIEANRDCLGQVERRTRRVDRNVNEIMATRHLGVAEAARLGSKDERHMPRGHRL